MKGLKRGKLAVYTVYNDWVDRSIKGAEFVFSEKMDLRLPGPVQVPREIQRAMLRSFDHPMMDYRTEEHGKIFREASHAMKAVFRTQQDVFLLTGSGTSAIEAAVVNTISPSDAVLICVTGHFGEYLVEIVKRVGATVLRIDVPWGQVVDPEKVADALEAHPGIKAVFVTHCETSTGALNPVESLARIVRQYDALFVVDATSSLGGAPLYMDDWGIDIVAAGGQKALMLPPGIAMIAVSNKAWRVIEDTNCPSFYFDLQKYREFGSRGQPPYTPNIALVNGLLESCRMIEDAGGMEAAYNRHAHLRDMTRAGIRALGLCLYVHDTVASPTVTSVLFEQENADDFRAMMRKQFHVAIGGGLGKLKGKLLRIGHMGYTDAGDMLKLLAVLELALHRTGIKVDFGAAVKAAQQTWLLHQDC